MEGDINDAGFASQASYYIAEAADNLVEIGKDLQISDDSKKIAGGAALGAVFGIPIVGWAAGAFIGAGIIAYRQVQKNKSGKDP